MEAAERAVEATQVAAARAVATTQVAVVAKAAAKAVATAKAAHRANGPFATVSAPAAPWGAAKGRAVIREAVATGAAVLTVANQAPPIVEQALVRPEAQTRSSTEDSALRQTAPSQGPSGERRVGNTLSIPAPAAGALTAKSCTAGRPVTILKKGRQE